MEFKSKNNRSIAMFNQITNDYPFEKVKSTIEDLCIADFVKKSLIILESTPVVPCSMYTYDIFYQMFTFMQRGDCTADIDGVESWTSTDTDKMRDLIVDGLITEMPGLKEQEEQLKKEVKKMYGQGEFPFLSIKAKHHQGSWWFSYNITR